MRSWVPEAADSGYNLDHLPYGVLDIDGRAVPVVRIGDHALDLLACHKTGLLPQGEWTTAGTLDGLLAAGPDVWALTRSAITTVLEGARPAALPTTALVSLRESAPPRLPFTVRDYVDFYSSIHHATNVGRLFRPDDPPLLPNWRHLPVGYHGRSATVAVSGTDVVRPAGQLGVDEDGAVQFGPTERLDIELEVGFVVGGAANAACSPLSIVQARRRLFGIVLLNDWSARDIQAWEYRPLGPFLGKSFQTQVAAWITPMAALTAARTAPPPQSPPVADYLQGDGDGALDLNLHVDLAPAGTSAQTISRVNFADMYWTAAQQLAHMAAGGAVVRPGELFGSGTVSGPESGTAGSLLELTYDGTVPMAVAGTTRTFLEDGDTVTLFGDFAGPAGGRLTLAPVSGTIRPRQKTAGVE